MLIYRYCVIRLVSSYGNMRAVPVGPMATSFARIAGAKTLTPQVLREISALGIPLMVDASFADRFRAQREWGFTVPAAEYRPQAEEEELDPMMEAHLDNKAEHGT